MMVIRIQHRKDGIAVVEGDNRFEFEYSDAYPSYPLHVRGTTNWMRLTRAQAIKLRDKLDMIIRRSK